ncbi:MAG: AAA family ATPase [Phormidesmis sp.]
MRSVDLAMIPKQLILRDFLSYREVTLDFGGLHVACVCGPNGAGKSSLLEAIAWCVWGQSRVCAEDDIVRQGAKEAQVSFAFEHSAQAYRIIRTRRRNQTSALEFQVETDTGYKSITQKGVRATQQFILAQLKIDYDTFVNAAYLRQGRADEFMLKRPSDRKQVLAELLNLSHYDALAEQAKEQSRTYKAQLQPLEAVLTRLSAQMDAQSDIQRTYDTLQAELTAQQQQQQQCQQALVMLKETQKQRAQQQQQLTLIQQQYQHQQTVLAQSKRELAIAQQQLAHTQNTLAQADTIQQRQRQLLQLRASEEQFGERFEQYQKVQSQRLQIQQQIAHHHHQRAAKIAQIEGQLTHLQTQVQEFQQILSRKEEVSNRLAQLRTARKQLRQLDRMEAQSAPLRQRMQKIEGQIGQAHTRLLTRIEELGNSQVQMSDQQTQAPQLMQKAEEVAHRIAYLEQRREYQEALRQKGLERRSFMERLRADQRNHEVSLARFDQTLFLLDASDMVCCPLCEQALGGKQQQILRDRTLKERDEIQNQIWAIREQLAVSEREIQVLRQEYRSLEDELAKYAPILEERGLLKAKLASADSLQDRLQAMSAERAQLERCLQENDYAQNLQEELKQVEQRLAEMAYDDRNHALLRSQVDRLRWSELKYAEIKQTERRLKHVEMQRPQLQAELDTLQQQSAHPLTDALAQMDEQLAEIDYRLDQHNQIRSQLKTAREWAHQYQALQQAKQDEGLQNATVRQLEAVQQDAAREAETLLQALNQLQQALDDETVTAETIADKIAEAEAEIAAGRVLRDRQLSQLGRLQQQLSQLKTVAQQQEQQQKALEDLRHKYQVYKALAEAFGRNGIQALMIENMLPQLEAETNQILSKLSNHQLHIQFVTQRSGRSGRSKKSHSKKMIDTLDILIADARGTRPYETYSGGEAFRVNFSIRLAIARLLAMRSGTALQMLIVDEGFGTQDKEGCDRLIAAIEAIAPDFACILTITHMPHFREAFQTRIEVSKDSDGSHITISS